CIIRKQCGRGSRGFPANSRPGPGPVHHGAPRRRTLSPASRNQPAMSNTIAVIRGDGIGPEIMDATLEVLDALRLGLEYDFVDAGMGALEKHGELIPAATMDAIRRHRIALKGPLTTPVGGGFSSINVELRRRFDLYANVRPARSYPNTKSRFESGVDVITVRENTEGAYSAEGQEVSEDGSKAVSIATVTRKGSERVAR